MTGIGFRGRAGQVPAGVWLFALALGVRILAVVGTPGFRAQTDAGDFDRNAAALAATGHLPVSVLTGHGGPTAFRPPGLPGLLAGIDRILRVPGASARWEAGRLAEAVLGALAVVLVHALGRRLFPGARGQRVALGAGIAAAVYPPLVLLNTSLLSEALFIPLALAAVLAGLGARERFEAGRRRAGLVACGVAGGLVGLAALTRSNGIVIGLALAVLVSVPARGPSRWARLRRRGWLGPAVLGLGVALVLVPWTVRNASVFGGALVPTSTETGYALAGVYNAEDQSDRVPYPGFWRPPLAEMAAIERRAPGVDEAQMSAELTSDALGYLRAHPGSLLTEAWASLRGLLGLRGPGFERWIAGLLGQPRGLAVLAWAAFFPLAALAGVGAWWGWRDRERRGPGGPEGRRVGHAAVWAVPVLLLLSTLFVSGEARYRVPADPFGLLLAAFAVDRSGILGRARRARRAPGGSGLGLL